MLTVYVLRLEHNKYYVGKTHDFDRRYRDHCNGRGSEWTKKYKPISIFNRYENCTDYDEIKFTLEMMTEYGIDNVRGGPFCQVNLTESNKESINAMINDANNKCHHCSGNHFIKNCPQKLKSKSEVQLEITPKVKSQVEIMPQVKSQVEIIPKVKSKVEIIPKVNPTPKISMANITDQNPTKEKLDKVDNIVFASDQKYQLQQLIDEMSPTNKTRIKSIFKDERITIDKLKKVISYSIDDKCWYVYDDNKIFPNKNILERFDFIKYPKKGDLIHVTVSDLINQHRHEFENNVKIGRITIDAYLTKIDLNSFKNQDEKGGVPIKEIYNNYIEWRKKSGNDKYFIKNKSDSFKVIEGLGNKNYLYDIRLCSRCGRNSHLVEECFAKVHLNGSFL